MKKILLLSILLIAILGLFLSYNLNKPTNTPDLTQSPSNEPNNQPGIIPQGNPELAKQVIVDLSLQKAFLYEKGLFVREFSVSSGKPSTPTPTGTFTIIHKQDMVYSKIAGCWLAFWSGFTLDGKYGFHETPVCDGIREGEEEIGEPVSAGCLRLKVGDAEALYNWMEIGTSIEIHSVID